MDVSNWIRESRKAAGLTQTALGEVLCVGKANVSSWEHGGHQPSYAQMLKISQLTRSPIPLPEGVHLPPSNCSAEAWDVAQAVDSLPPGRLRTILAAMTLNNLQQIKALASAE